MFMVLSFMTHVISRVHPVHLTNAGQRQAATDPQIRPTDLFIYENQYVISVTTENAR